MMDPQQAPPPTKLGKRRRDFIPWQPAHAITGLSVAILGALGVLASLVLPTFPEQGTCAGFRDCVTAPFADGRYGAPLSAPITGWQLLQMGDARTEVLYIFALACLLLAIPAFFLLRAGKPWLTLRAINLAVGALIVGIAWLIRAVPVTFAPTMGNIDFMTGFLSAQYASGMLVNSGVTAGMALVFIGSCAELIGLHILISAKYPMNLF